MRYQKLGMALQALKSAAVSATISTQNIFMKKYCFMKIMNNKKRVPRIFDIFLCLDPEIPILNYYHGMRNC